MLLDVVGFSLLLIYFVLVFKPSLGGDLYVFRQQDLSWDCIGRFPSRSCPEVKRDQMENGYASRAALRISERGRLVPALYTCMGGAYFLDERHLLIEGDEDEGEVVLVH